MKTILNLIAAVMVSVTGLSAQALEKHTLHYRFDNKHLEVPVHTPSYDDAITVGAERCYTFFTQTAKLDKEKKLDLVDVCANPRKS